MAFRGREFIFYWVTVKEQISTRHASPNVQKGIAYLKARPFSPAWSVGLIKIFPLQNLPWPPPTRYTGSSSLDSQAGGAHRQFVKSWTTSHKHELYGDSERSRSGFFGCRRSRPFLGRVTGAIFTQGWSITLSKRLQKLKTLFFLAIIYNSSLKKNPPKVGFPVKEF